MFWGRLAGVDGVIVVPLRTEREGDGEGVHGFLYSEAEQLEAER